MTSRRWRRSSRRSSLALSLASAPLREVLRFAPLSFRDVAVVLAVNALALVGFDVLKRRRRRGGNGVLRTTVISVSIGMLLHGGAATASAADSPSGAALYRRYCASCHGTTGRGDGPVSAALRVAPTDLTRVRTGVPELMRQIDGRSAIPAHGTSQMPVWGEVFEESLVGEPYRRRTALQQLQILAEYVRSLRDR